MKNNLLLLLFIAFFLGMASCNNDDKDNIQNTENHSVPELEFPQGKILVKIGAENKVTFNITQGGGEYNAFSLNENVAVVEINDDQIIVAGVASGITSIIVSDKNGYYRKKEVQVYKTDVLELEKTEVALETRPSHPVTEYINVTIGNGGYNVISDNDKVQVSVTDNGVISVTGAVESISDEITATVTVTDVIGLSTTFSVLITGTTNPYTEAEMEAIYADKSRRYYLDDANQINPDWSVNFQNKIEGGKVTYGWTYYSYKFLLTFDGDKNKGKKENAKLSCNNYVSPNFIKYEIDIILEIAQNDGTNIWGTFSFIKDGKSHRGYFCDTVNP